MAGMVRQVPGGRSFRIGYRSRRVRGRRRAIGLFVAGVSVLAVLALSPVGALAQRGAATAPPDWPAWSDAAWSAAKFAVNHWTPQARLRNVRINGPVAVGAPGCLAGPAIKGDMKRMMIANRVPGDIADAWAGAVSDAWAMWHGSVQVPGLAWYPAFNAVAAPQAPRMPNTPTPLSALPASRASELDATSLKNRIRRRLRAAANQPGADQAIGQFTTKFNRAFNTWVRAQTVTGVMGQGPVPAYAPPHTPVGAVVNGSVIETPGVLRGSQFGLPYK